MDIYIRKRIAFPLAAIFLLNNNSYNIKNGLTYYIEIIHYGVWYEWGF